MSWNECHSLTGLVIVVSLACVSCWLRNLYAAHCQQDCISAAATACQPDAAQLQYRTRLQSGLQQLMWSRELLIGGTVTVAMFQHIDVLTPNIELAEDPACLQSSVFVSSGASQLRGLSNDMNHMAPHAA